MLSVPIQSVTKKNANSVLFLLRVLRNLYPYRTFVRRHCVPRHFFRIGRLMKQINLPSTLLHGGPIVKKEKKEISVLIFLYVERPDTKRAKKRTQIAFFFYVYWKL